MSERYSRLYSQEQSLYTVGSPVAITASALLKDTQTGKVLAQIKFTNISPKKIKALTVSIQPQDTIGNTLGAPIEYQYLDLSAERDQSFGQKVPVKLPDSSTRTFDVKVTEVIFVDNTIWNSGSEAWEILPSRITLEDVIPDQELRKQFRLEYGQSSRYWYQTHKDLWYCTCGILNHDKEHGCHKCGQTANKLASLNMRELEQRKNERLTYEKTIREQKAQSQAIATRRTAKAVTIILLIAIISATIFYFATNIFIPEMKYKNGQSLLKAGEYAGASAAFTELGDYKDAATMVLEVEYQRGFALLENKKYYDASVAFKALGDYKDSATLVLEVEYQKGTALLAEAKYADAHATFSKILDYKDSSTMVLEVEYQKAMSFLIAEKYEEALNTYLSIKGYADVDTLLLTNENLVAAAKAKRTKYTTIGNTIAFGKYLQKTIEWKILAVDSDKILVISKDAVDRKQYNTQYTAVSWKTSSLRDWLNDDFVTDTFSEKEQEKILTTTVINSGSSTNDKLFILSVAEAKKYLPSDNKRVCVDSNNGTAWWWLRDLGKERGFAAIVREDGSIHKDGTNVNAKIPAAGGVRPVMWLDLDDILSS